MDAFFEGLLIFAFVIFIICLILYWNGNSKIKKTHAMIEKYSVQNSVKILDHQLTETEAGRAITGHVQNTCDLQHGTAQYQSNMGDT